MNVRLLRKVIKSIKDEPRRLHMGEWGKKVNSNKPQNPPCGTKACIAGHVAFVKKQLVFNDADIAYIKDGPSEGIGPWARQALGLDITQSDRLFYFKAWNGGVLGWPRQFSTAYNKAKSAKERAKVTIARIEHFIKTKGQE